MNQRKGQSGIELIALTTFLFFIFSGVYVSFLRNDIDVATSEIHLKVNDLGKLAAFEINSAAQVGDGYERNFTLPLDVHGFKYNISLDGSFVVINTSKNSLFIPTVASNVTGSFMHGKNTIRNSDGYIYVNQ